MKVPLIVASPACAPTRSLAVRLLWMAILWAAGVACVLVVSLVLRAVLHR